MYWRLSTGCSPINLQVPCIYATISATYTRLLASSFVLHPAIRDNFHRAIARTTPCNEHQYSYWSIIHGAHTRRTPHGMTNRKRCEQRQLLCGLHGSSQTADRSQVLVEQMKNTTLKNMSKSNWSYDFWLLLELIEESHSGFINRSRFNPSKHKIQVMSDYIFRTCTKK